MMTTHIHTTVFGAVALSVVILGTSPAAQIALTPKDTAALQEWTLNVEAYLVLREQAVRAVPPRLVTDPREILAAASALAAEIRARRPGARMGDLFTADVRRTFRKQIARALTEHQIAVADLIADLQAEILPGAPGPAVNERFPLQLGAAMPPCVLAALPSLPKALQFRLVGRDLILIDLDPNLVIDMLPEALPRPATVSVARPVD